ncbi:MAG: hypothetical protein FJ137_07100 [Deltaproteobacteria bacterium]|nr:hypothetical protein [Deltaproteobacteria bacterium]
MSMPPPARPSLVLACVAAATLACPTPPPDGGAGEGEGENEGEGDPGPHSCVPDDDTDFPTPRADVTDAVGSAATFDVATWNIRNFPSSSSTVATVADMITSLDLDLLALQEVASQAAFDELLARLPHHEGVLSSHTYSDGAYQKLAVVYRCGALAPGPPALLFSGDGGAFPRPPLQVPFHYDDGTREFDFTVIVVHLKAGEDADALDRRGEAFIKLGNYLASYVASAAADEVIVLGDFNERVEDEPGTSNWRPLLDPTRFVVRTQPLADAGEASFLSSRNSLIDHIVTTRAFDDEVGAGVAVIPRVEFDVANYRAIVSDHRPVVLTLLGL